MKSIVWFAVYGLMIVALWLAARWVRTVEWHRRLLWCFGAAGVGWTVWCNWRWFAGEEMLHFITGVCCVHICIGVVRENARLTRDLRARGARAEAFEGPSMPELPSSGGARR